MDLGNCLPEISLACHPEGIYAVACPRYPLHVIPKGSMQDEKLKIYFSDKCIIEKILGEFKNNRVLY
jgi:hypothetical protein